MKKTQWITISSLLIVGTLAVGLLGGCFAGGKDRPTAPSDAFTIPAYTLPHPTDTEASTAPTIPAIEITSAAVSTEGSGEGLTETAEEVSTQENTALEGTTAVVYQTDENGETHTAFPKDAVSASIEAIYPTDYATTHSSYIGLAGLTANDYNGRIVRTMSEEDLMEIDTILGEITTDGMTRSEKIRAVHDWIITHVNYDYKYAAQTVHVALEEGLSVCNGYADLFMVFMTELHIPCAYGRGFSREVYHMWNIVQLEDGFWYFIDVTWDDPTSVWAHRNDKGAAPLYDYFLLTKQEFTDHTSDYPYTPSPLATSPAE